jgi:hypothetical protein
LRFPVQVARAFEIAIVVSSWRGTIAQVGRPARWFIRPDW